MFAPGNINDFDLSGVGATKIPTGASLSKSAPAESGFFGDLGDLVLAYGTARATVDLQRRSDDIPAPDQVDVRTGNVPSQSDVEPAGVLDSLEPWQMIGLGVAGVLGMVLIVRLLD